MVPVPSPNHFNPYVPVLAFAMGYVVCDFSLYSVDGAVRIFIGFGWMFLLSSGLVLLHARPIRTEE